MLWWLLRKAPKWVFVFGVIIGSSLLFGFWWVGRTSKQARPTYRPPSRPAVVAEDIGPKLALLESKIGRLILVDNDLYEVDSGTLIFKSWLKEGMPNRVFYDTDAKRVYAQYDRGFIRYGLSGVRDAELVHRSKPVLDDDLKWAVFARGEEIWKADVDWTAFRFANERKLASVPGLFEQHFAGSLLLASQKTLIMRLRNQFLRVVMDTGEFTPIRIPSADLGKRISADDESIVGLDGTQFYCYDVDSNKEKLLDVGRGAINEYQWLDNDRCAFIASTRGVALYDRKKHSLSEIAKLPEPCAELRLPSPDGRFVFCGNRKSIFLIDTKQKSATKIVGGDGLYWVNAGTFAFSREVPDSTFRGTWIQKPGQDERRVSSEPYLVVKEQGWILPLKAAGLIIFATRRGLSRMDTEGGEAAEFLKVPRAPVLVLAVDEWNY